jgi:release factor glutamine methyltransferase
MSSTIGAALQQAIQCLTRNAIAEPRATAEVLLADLLTTPRLSLVLETRRRIDPHQAELYAGRIQRRLQGEPIQYITGVQEFWSLPFSVNPHVLIPRSETELLVEYGVQALQTWQPPSSTTAVSVLDVGVGSGNIALSLAPTLPAIRVCGIDLSIDALHVAQENARRLGVSGQLTWVCGDLVTGLRRDVPRFALCVSNLPYVTTMEWEQLPHHIKAYEPPTALLGGDDGLDVIRRLVITSPHVLAPGGTLLLEVGWQQAGCVVELIRQQRAFGEVGIYPDFAGIDRVVWARRCG